VDPKVQEQLARARLKK